METAGEHYRKMWMKTQLEKLDAAEARERPTLAPAGTRERCRARLAAADARAGVTSPAPASRPVGRTSTTGSGPEYRRVVKCVIGDDECVSEFIGRPDQKAIVDAHADAQLQRWATSGRRMERGSGGPVLLRGGKR